MLALAKRSVVADRVDVLVKIGLGKLGQVNAASIIELINDISDSFQADLTLARYTCVAIQRLNGSAKKIKGTYKCQTLARR